MSNFIYGLTKNKIGLSLIHKRSKTILKFLNIFIPIDICKIIQEYLCCSCDYFEHDFNIFMKSILNNKNKVILSGQTNPYMGCGYITLELSYSNDKFIILLNDAESGSVSMGDPSHIPKYGYGVISFDKLLEITVHGYSIFDYIYRDENTLHGSKMNYSDIKIDYTKIPIENEHRKEYNDDYTYMWIELRNQYFHLGHDVDIIPKMYEEYIP